MYIAKFCRVLYSWVCHNRRTDKVHSAWANREDAVLMANDLNKRVNKLATVKKWW